MSENRSYYKENLIQWVWKQLEFDCSGLKTVCGQNVEIISPGELNRGAGPDFLNASVVAGGMRWHGSVEIHNNAADWEAHGHHLDPGFNQVILHVVFANPHIKARTENGSTPLVLHLKPYLNKALHRLIYLKENKKLPCGGSVSFIHQKAFEKQAELAHREYFSFKTDEFIKGYDPGLVPSEAWKRCFIEQVYSTLGIPSNRDAMKKLAGKMHGLLNRYETIGEFVDAAAGLAFDSPESAAFGWSRGGMRPPSRPENRVGQAAALHFVIGRSSLRFFLEQGASSWNVLKKQVSNPFRVGGKREAIIKSTVWFPALFLLGELFHYEKLKKEAFREWMVSGAGVPAEIAKPFLSAGFELNRDTRKPGLAHQYKRYCLEKQCHRCEVFKSAIRS